MRQLAMAFLSLISMAKAVYAMDFDGFQTEVRARRVALQRQNRPSLAIAQDVVESKMRNESKGHLPLLLDRQINGAPEGKRFARSKFGFKGTGSTLNNPEACTTILHEACKGLKGIPFTKKQIQSLPEDVQLSIARAYLDRRLLEYSLHKCIPAVIVGNADLRVIDFIDNREQYYQMALQKKINNSPHGQRDVPMPHVGQILYYYNKSTEREIFHVPEDQTAVLPLSGRQLRWVTNVGISAIDLMYQMRLLKNVLLYNRFSGGREQFLMHPLHSAQLKNLSESQIRYLIELFDVRPSVLSDKQFEIHCLLPREIQTNLEHNYELLLTEEQCNQKENMRRTLTTAQRKIENKALRNTRKFANLSISSIKKKSVAIILCCLHWRAPHAFVHGNYRELMLNLIVPYLTLVFVDSFLGAQVIQDVFLL